YVVSYGVFSLRLVAYVIVVAPIMGWLGNLFGRAIKAWSAKRPHQVKLLVLLPIVGLVTGLVAAVYPHIMGNGRGLA
ncbi:chloride channel protein, partial [Limosilactobacillus fermentum]|uniref:chloride channel protein n=1 Tax=Limosilactobacillus fermentum TaxID=1613 RepID=UPI0030E9E8D7